MGFEVSEFLAPRFGVLWHGLGLEVRGLGIWV